MANPVLKIFLGTDGIPMTADIFFGVIHYQRLRHMVSDKFQVRSQGIVLCFLTM